LAIKSQHAGYIQRYLNLRGDISMKKAHLLSEKLTRILLLFVFGFVSFYSACGFGVTITEEVDFPDTLGPQSVFALELGSNTVSGHVTTNSSSSDIDILTFAVPPEYKISSLILTGTTFPNDVTDPVFYIVLCQLSGGAGCGSPSPVTPSTTLPLAFPTTGTYGVGILGDSGSFANCGTTSGCGYTVEVVVSEVPIPAAFWLFCFGLLGLGGIITGVNLLEKGCCSVVIGSLKSTRIKNGSSRNRVGENAVMRAL
jgi:hypothetical protein